MDGYSKFTALFFLLTSLVHTTQADPIDYRFLSLHSANAAIGSFHVSFPAINNQGDVVWIQGNFPDSALMRSDGLTQTIVAIPPVNNNFTGIPASNDFGQIAVGVNSFNGIVRRLYLYEPSGSFTELVSGLFDCTPGEFCSFGNTPSLNNLGQVAAKATLNDNGTPVFTLRIFESGGSIEVVRQAASVPGDVFNFGDPSINNLGNVAFGAGQVDNPGPHVFSGSGGPLMFEGTVPIPIGGGTPFDAYWNDSGLIGAVNGRGVHLLQNGLLLDTIINPLTSTGILVNPSRISINNLGNIAFRSNNDAPCSAAHQTGVFTGGDEINDVVLRTGDPIFGGVVHTCGPNSQSIRMGAHAINDKGEIVFLVETITDATFVSHLVRAIPLSPLYDSEDDGVANDIDNCLLVSNADQFDADNDGFGNSCDGDVNNDGATNFADFSVLADAFLGTDPVSDLNGDGFVNFADIAIFAGLFLTAPGPSALAE